MRPKQFLTAKWENLIIASYKVDQGLLEQYLPKGLEPDTIEGKAFISLVAFNFNETKVKGIKVPFHVNFPEINLRFYVKDSRRRGVVFIRELVPRYFVAKIANLLFNENYMSAPMKNNAVAGADNIVCSHNFNMNGKNYRIKIEAENKSYMPPYDSAENFFKEHEWGFAKTRKGETLAYRVEHPFWEVFPVVNFHHNIDFAEVYGEKWKSLCGERPSSIVFAKGSAVKVYSAEKILNLDSSS